MDSYKENSGYLDIGDGHELFFRTCGNMNGKKILRFHGGPGGSSKPIVEYGYNLEKYFIVIFDQRGCGQSRFKELFFENNTQKIISDANQLLEYLEIDKVYLNASSWGSTLALIFAINFPEKILGISIDGLFMGTRKAVEFLENNSTIPDVKDFRESMISKFFLKDDLTKKEVDTLVFDKLKNGNSLEQRKATIISSIFETNLIKPNQEVIFLNEADITESQIKSAQIAMHFQLNNFFLKEDFILNNIANIQNIPIAIIHGRLDQICSPESSWYLNINMANSNLKLIAGEGHSFSENGKIIKMLILDNLCNN